MPFLFLTTNLSESNVSSISNIITIIGAVITILGIIHNIYTNNSQQMKIEYSTHIMPILSNAAIKQEIAILDNMHISYKGVKLRNPYLLSLKIKNTGNVAIENPEMRIKLTDNTTIIPGYFEQLPPGYEDKWKFGNNTHNTCELSLKHINSSQEVKAIFFLDEKPENKIVFECPVYGIKLKKVSGNANFKNSATGFSMKNINIIILALLALSVIFSYRVIACIDLIIFEAGLATYLDPVQLYMFVFGIMAMTFLFNSFGIKTLDEYVIEQRKNTSILFVTTTVVMAVLGILITFNVIYSNEAQIVIAIVMAIVISLLNHIFLVTR